MACDEIECDQCHRTLHYLEFSKQQRKADDPICMRCVAWNETQHYGVVPAPLSTGHVSKEEETGEVWARKTFLTDEDYCTPQAPISDRNALGLEGDGPVTDEMLQQLNNRAAGLAVSSGANSVVSNNTAQTSRAPPHIAKRSAANSTATSDVASTSNASEAGSSKPAFVPPHLRRKPGIGGPASTMSVSTATTIREAKEQARQDRATGFNAWDAQGNLVKKTHVPSTVASSGETSVGGSSLASTSRKGTSSFPRPPEMSRPARQTDMNPVPPGGFGRRNNFVKPKKADEGLVPEEWPESHW